MAFDPAASFDLHEQRRQRMSTQDYVCFVQGDAKARWQTSRDVTRQARHASSRSIDAHHHQRWSAALYAAARALYRERWEK